MLNRRTIAIPEIQLSIYREAERRMVLRLLLDHSSKLRRSHVSVLQAQALFLPTEENHHSKSITRGGQTEGAT